MIKLKKPTITTMLIIFVGFMGVFVGCTEEGGNDFENGEETKEQKVDEELYDTSLPAKELVEGEYERLIDKLDQDWEAKGGDDLIYPKDTEVKPGDFETIITASYSPNEKTVAFALAGPYVTLLESTAVGVIDMVDDDIIITNITMGQVHGGDGVIWSDQNNYLTYSTIFASGASDLHVDSIKEENNIKKINGELLNYDDELVSFKNVHWEEDGSFLAFTSFEVGEKNETERYWIYDLEQDELEENTEQ